MQEQLVGFLTDCESETVAGAALTKRSTGTSTAPKLKTNSHEYNLLKRLDALLTHV
jgi:hypothetical protein